MNVKTAVRTLDLFETFAREGRPLPLSELGRLLAIPVSSCFALVQTLQNRGYIYEVQRRSGYYPTRRLQAVAEQIAASDPLLDRIRPTLLELRDQTGETAVVGKLQDARVLYLDVAESQQRIRYIASIGEFRQPHANSLGKALLAALPQGERARLLKDYDWTAPTPRTLSSPAAFEREMEAITQRGWAVNAGESVADLAAVACALRLNRDWYAISVAGPLYRMEPHLAAYGEMLRAACATLTDES
ncbi:IclR family transcriptional regulator [Ferrovibrio terrae]|uniref:IclR family transcriptional regulator n=1 Tax=Ferrovibrio terrae TaxID=2594003 RepID=UPI003137C8BF